jgi:hypothetical protein
MDALSPANYSFWVHNYCVQGHNDKTKRKQIRDIQLPSDFPISTIERKNDNWTAAVKDDETISCSIANLPNDKQRKVGQYMTGMCRVSQGYKNITYINLTCGTLLTNDGWQRLDIATYFLCCDNCIIIKHHPVQLSAAPTGREVRGKLHTLLLHLLKVFLRFAINGDPPTSS